MTSIGTLIFTALFGKKVGEDKYGNKYFHSSAPLGKYVGRYNKERRWVIYNGKSEPSKVPPVWHGWLHYNTDTAPDKESSKKVYSWEKDHLPNLTGTDFSYLPPGHKKKSGLRDKATSDYSPWRPK